MTAPVQPGRRASPEGATGAGDGPLPPALEALVEDFEAVGVKDRLQMLLEIGLELPELEEPWASARDSMERVDECQSPVFLASEVGDGPERRVTVVVDAPREAPTTRGFAAVLKEGLDGAPAADVLAVPDAFYLRLGLGQAVSPLRLRGMSGMLSRLKRQVREATAG